MPGKTKIQQLRLTIFIIIAICSLMKCFALTGGIATGKSTVANMLSDAGIPVIDADILSRQVVEPGTPGHHQITQKFDKDYFDSDGKLNRAKMASLIFEDKTAKQELENIIHPLIAEALQLELQKIQAPFVVYVAPLIFEKNIQNAFEATILVDIPIELQIKCVMKRDLINEEIARERICSQMSRENKIALADYVIHNGSTLEETASQLNSVWLKLTGMFLFR